MDKNTQDLIRDLGPDTRAAREAKKKQEPAPYIREGSLAGELEADVVNNGFTIVLPQISRAQNPISVFFIVYTPDGPAQVITDWMAYDPETLYVVKKEDIDNPFLPGTEVVVFGFLSLGENLQTGRRSYRVV